LAADKKPDLQEVVRILWTADHLAAAQRLETTVIGAAQAATTLWAPPHRRGGIQRRRDPSAAA
jgi:hypothetical protein